MKTFEHYLAEAKSELEGSNSLLVESTDPKPKSLEQTFKDSKLKVLLILDDTQTTILHQEFVDNENEARKIAKAKMKEGNYAKYFDIAANKTQQWYKPVKD